MNEASLTFMDSRASDKDTIKSRAKAQRRKEEACMLFFAPLRLCVKIFFP
jgi:hypothetical protein